MTEIPQAPYKDVIKLVNMLNGGKSRYIPFFLIKENSFHDKFQLYAGVIPQIALIRGSYFP